MVAVLMVCRSKSFAADAAKRPNVLIFYVDDMGWAQPNCYGGKLAKTPNIDALASAGIRFTDGYVSACICGPSRAGLMTGRYQAHSGHDANTSNRPGTELVLSETTMAQRMKAIGYTTGIVGKWHLGSTPGHLPPARGFEWAFGSISNINEAHFYRNEELIDDPPGAPVTTPIYVNESMRFLDANANKDKPWFLYLAFNAVHAPHVASQKWLDQFKSLDKRTGEYAAMIAEVDEGIGQVMAKLRAMKLEENTLIFLISDNGGAAPQAEMGGLRGHKWLVWEGGIRVSWLASWKGHIPSGRVVHEPVIQLDVLPTAISAGGGDVSPGWDLDGVNLMPLLEGKVDKLDPRELFFRFGVQYAVRSGDWKLVKASKDMEPMLVNLATDPGEKTDLSGKNPDKKKELQLSYAKWNASMLPPRWEDKRWNGEEERQQQLDAKKEKKAKK